MIKNTRIRLAAASATAIIGTFTASACSTGSTIIDTPKTSAKASSMPESASSPVTPQTTPTATMTPNHARVGDTITVKGMDADSQLDVTVVGVADPAQCANDFLTPEAGKRYVGIHFKLVNTGTTVYSDSPSNGAQITDSQGQKFEATYADLTAGPSMSSDVRLAPGEKTLGWIAFEVPTTSKLATVQFALDSGFADQAGEWKLS